MTDETELSSHKQKWNKLAEENDRYYVRSTSYEQSDEEFEESGKKDVRNFLEKDDVIASALNPFSEKTLLEIGCGSGRLTKSLARKFNHVYAVDISAVMLEKARNFAQADNVTFSESDGALLNLGDGLADIAFSYIVYQHFPSLSAIEISFREVRRVLRGDGWFKVQVRGLRHGDKTNWAWGPHFREEEAIALAENAGFAVEGISGVGQRSLWLTLHKRRAE